MQAVEIWITQVSRAFRAKGLPVVLVSVIGGAPGRTESAMAAGKRPTDWAELVTELDQQPSDLLVAKKT